LKCAGRIQVRNMCETLSWSADRGEAVYADLGNRYMQIEGLLTHLTARVISRFRASRPNRAGREDAARLRKMAEAEPHEGFRYQLPSSPSATSNSLRALSGGNRLTWLDPARFAVRRRLGLAQRALPPQPESTRHQPQWCECGKTSKRSPRRPVAPLQVSAQPKR
jgi:hypothetical protein